MSVASAVPPRRPARASVRALHAVILAGLLSAGLAAPAAADTTGPSFTTSTLSTSPGTGPTAVITADLDGDGDLDIATANYASRDVTVLTRESDGSHTARVVGSVARPDTWSSDFVMSLTAADVDGDGDLDLAAVVPADTMMGWESGYLAVLTQAGDGTYATSFLTVAGDNLYDPYALVAADLDDDGDLDLATANTGDGTITTFTRGGDGSYATATFPVASSATNPAALVAADLDGDGRLELAVANDWPGNVTVLARQPDGSYTSRVAAVTGGDSRPRSLVAADLDDDRDLDLAVANYGSGNVRILTNEADGSWSVTSAGDTDGPFPVDLEVADFEGDGDADLVTLNSGYDGYGDVTTFTRAADGSYSTSTPGPVNRPTTFATGDLDADSDSDLVLPDVTADTLTVFTNEAFDAPPTVGIPTPALTNSTSSGRGVTDPAVGDTLSATTGETAPTGAAVTYQWFRTTPGVRLPIPGATGDTYTLTPDDLGSTVQVAARGTFDGYATGRAFSDRTGAVVAGPLGDPQVTIIGTAQVAASLTAEAALPDVPGAAVSWQWQSLDGGTPASIEGATSATFTPPAALVGRELRVVATVTAPGYPSSTGYADTVAVAKGTLASPVVTIRGVARQGRTVRARVVHASVLPSGHGVRYRWRADGRNIAGATLRTLTLARPVVGTRITVTVTTTAPGYRKVVVTSVATRKVAKN